MPIGLCCSLCFGLSLGFGLGLLADFHAVEGALFALDEHSDVLVQLLQLLDVVGVIFLVTRPIVVLDCRLIGTTQVLID